MMWKLASALLFVVGLNLVVGVVASGEESYSRNDFPAASRFVFGAGTSAYQVEGAAHEDGRTPAIFDTFAHSGLVFEAIIAVIFIQTFDNPYFLQKTSQVIFTTLSAYTGTSGANGDVACDQYHKYKEDVQLMVDTGLEAYRFSISWSRLIPNGRGPVNPKGLQYYNNLINELISHGIQPHVTLHHVDLPQALEDEYGGWISRKVVQDFTTFADVCFRMFGDRVRHWTTFNEANVFVLGGYDAGFIPPQRCSSPFGFVTCAKGNSTIEPYLAAHYILISHASVARLYKQKYQEKQKGYIGFNLFAYYFYPFTNTTEDILATQRANDFYLGWFANPLVYGDYPETVKNSARSRIPSFTALESEQIKGSVDFFGINFYDVRKVKNSPTSLNEESRDFLADMEIEFKLTMNKQQGYSEYPVLPWGLQGVMEYFKQTYGNPPIYVHENGLMMRRNTTLEDWPRVRALQAYIGAALDSLRNGSDMRGYFTWSFLDVYEILDGYNSGYGLYYVDLDDPDLKRYPKLSSHWYSHFLKGGNSNSFIMNSKSVSSSHVL